MDYGWSQLNVATIYLAGGIEVLLVFVVLYVIGRCTRIRDTSLAAASLLLTCFAMMLVIAESQVVERCRMYAFISTVVVAFMAVPLTMIAVKSQVAKIAHPEGLGLMQGFFESSSRVSVICGLLMGGVGFKNRQVFGVCMAVVSVLVLVLLVASRRRIEEREEEMIALTEKNRDFRPVSYV